MLTLVHTLSMAATAYTPWIDARRLVSLHVQTDCGDVDSPVGILTLETTNDVATVEKEQQDGTTPASSAAVKLTSATASNVGTNWATGYDGVGAKASIATSSVATQGAFTRLKYTRTSGGAGDTLYVRWVGKLSYA